MYLYNIKNNANRDAIKFAMKLQNIVTDWIL